MYITCLQSAVSTVGYAPTNILTREDVVLTGSVYGESLSPNVALMAMRMWRTKAASPTPHVLYDSVHMRTFVQVWVDCIYD